MTNVEKGMEWARRFNRGERDRSDIPGDYDVGATARVIKHLLALAKEVERIHCAALAAELDSIPVDERNA